MAQMSTDMEQLRKENEDLKGEVAAHKLQVSCSHVTFNHSCSSNLHFAIAVDCLAVTATFGVGMLSWQSIGTATKRQYIVCADCQQSRCYSLRRF